MSDALRHRLGHAFARPDLFVQALTHRSFGSPHNERLEFVGDAVLNCVVAQSLYERFADLPEGDLSRMRASLVNREALARVARALHIGADIRLGEGEQKSGGAAKPALLADALEALFGAVFVDAGFDAARRVIETCYADVLSEAGPASLGKDPKTRLQEYLQARRLPVPEYVVVATSGEAHAQQFVVECRVAALSIVATGEGPSRRIAEQAAAEVAEAMAMAGGRAGAARG